MQNIICFVSDFGLDDTWVGVCHAVIHQACPQARVVDLGHQIAPFDIRKGAAVAAAGVYQLPDAIHLAVVDPGVGGGREDLCIVTKGGARLVGPDNGVLIPAARRGGGIAEVFGIEPAKLDFTAPLPTFHARDVLAPAAAALACGVDPGVLGVRMDPDRLMPAPFGPCVREGAIISAEVVDIDRFGSVRIAVTADDLVEHGVGGGAIEISFGHLSLEVPFGLTFSDVPDGEPVALVDSSGWLTLAVRAGSAAERYGIEPGSVARVRIHP
ncbi:MAG: SAM-dependent chlorinase/fluorinase [Coriobacteriia bacterium]|nr:SAM-dependent chlorinase/fluorinase [Coriobacteriia bacterium]